MTDNSYSGSYDRGKRSAPSANTTSHFRLPETTTLGPDLGPDTQVKSSLEALKTLGEEAKVKRDVRSVAKFIEVALVLDKAMFDKRPHSSRKDVIHDAIQVANIADLVRLCNENFTE